MSQKGVECSLVQLEKGKQKLSKKVNVRIKRCRVANISSAICF